MSKSLAALLGVLLLATAACSGSATEPDAPQAADEAGVEEPAEGVDVVVTTSVLGEVVRQVLAPDEDATVEVLLPPGADPHGYAPSAADAVALREADVVYAVGLGLEEALADSLEAAEEEGVRIVRLGPEVDPLAYGQATAVHDHGEEDEHADDDGGEHAEEDDHAHDDDEDGDAGGDEHADEGGEDHAGEDGHEDEEDHDHGPLDPHVWLDPIRVAQLGQEVATVHAELAPEDAEAVRAAADELEARMQALDEELAAMAEQLPSDRRELVTNHDALGYLAARYDFEVIATVLPGTSANVDVTSSAFTQLVELLGDTGVPAIFAETTSSDRLARALAEEVGDVEVVELYTGSLGEPGSGADSIEGMLRTNMERIVAALG